MLNLVICKVTTRLYKVKEASTVLKKGIDLCPVVIRLLSSEKLWFHYRFQPAKWYILMSDLKNM
jgi:hypothetical protein